MKGSCEPVVNYASVSVSISWGMDMSVHLLVAIILHRGFCDLYSDSILHSPGSHSRSHACIQRWLAQGTSKKENQHSAWWC